MIDVSVKCPVCSELIGMTFNDNDMDDPAFAEIVNEQPWTVICMKCDNTFTTHFKDHDACMEFHNIILCKWQPAIDLAREYIQQE